MMPAATPARAVVLCRVPAGFAANAVPGRWLLSVVCFSFFRRNFNGVPDQVDLHLFSPFYLL